MDDHLHEQVEYYRRRAAAYDDWWLRRGAYQLPPDLMQDWIRDVAEVERAADDFAPTGEVLELACGTGLFTRLFVEHANHITAVDSSPEVIEINRTRLPGARIDYVVDDVFGWPFPESTYDAVVFTYWLSHVPDGLLDAFWGKVRAALRPNGRVFLVDSTSYPSSDGPAPGGRTERRTLEDGHTFTVVKRYWTPVELEEHLTQGGWTCKARLTANEMIMYASVLPR